MPYVTLYIMQVSYSSLFLHKIILLLKVVIKQIINYILLLPIYQNEEDYELLFESHIQDILTQLIIETDIWEK